MSGSGLTNLKTVLNDSSWDVEDNDGPTKTWVIFSRIEPHTSLSRGHDAIKCLDNDLTENFPKESNVHRLKSSDH